MSTYAERATERNRIRARQDSVARAASHQPEAVTGALLLIVCAIVNLADSVDQRRTWPA